MHPLPATAQANPDTAGLSEQTGTALFGAGYASQHNLTTEGEPEPYAAITNEARHTGRLREGPKPATMKQPWQHMATRPDTPHGKPLHRRRAGIIEPVFAQLFHRPGRHLHYPDTNTDLEPHPWAARHNPLKAIRAKTRQITTSPPPGPALTS